MLPITIEQLQEAHNIGEYEPYQKDFIQFDKPHTNMCVLWGRKSGKTESLIARMALKLCNDRVPGVALNGGLGLISVGMTEARRTLAGVAAVLAGLGWEAVDQRGDMSEEDKTFYCTANEVQMPNLNRLLSLPAGHTGKTARPYSFYELSFDEADFINEAVYDATGPCLARYQGRQILCSTINPAGLKTTYFGRAFFGQMPNFQIWDIPTTQAKHISKQFLASELEAKGKAYFELNYLNKWRSASNAVFNHSLLAAVSAKQRMDKDEEEKKGELFIGQDYARYGADLNATAYNAWYDGKAHVFVEFASSDFRTTELARRLHARLKDRDNLRLIVTDESAMGSGVTDSLSELFGNWRVKGIMNHERVEAPEGMRSRYIKADLYCNAVRMMEEGRVILDCDPRIIHSLTSMEWYYTKKGDLNVFGNDNHAAEAIVRCLFPCFNKRSEQYQQGDISAQKPLSVSEDIDDSWLTE
jgi:hypothetical protein